MILERLKLWYRDQTFTKRLILIISLASSPTSFTFLDDYTRLEEQESDANQKLGVESKKFKEAKLEKSKIPELEEKFTETKNQLAEASRLLPNSFQMDSILEKTSTIAQNSGIELKLFQPQKPETSKSAYKYMKMPIKLSITGTYAQIASFFDHMLHLELLLHIGSYSLNPIGTAPPPQTSILKDLQNALSNSVRRIYIPDIELTSDTELVVFRALSPEEQAEDEKQKAQASQKEPTSSTPPPNSKGVGT